jgi:hypothetical protein
MPSVYSKIACALSMMSCRRRGTRLEDKGARSLSISACSRALRTGSESLRRFYAGWELAKFREAKNALWALGKEIHWERRVLSGCSFWAPR